MSHISVLIAVVAFFMTSVFNAQAQANTVKVSSAGTAAQPQHRPWRHLGITNQRSLDPMGISRVQACPFQGLC